MRIRFLLVLLITVGFVHGQDEVKSKGETFLKTNEYTHNLEQEKFFLHTNKTTYYSGEKVCFKVYVASDLFDTPYYKTTNLYINLYDANNKLTSNKLIYAENGVANGEITLANNLNTGKYYIQIETQWSRNFKDKYLSSINVINLKQKSNVLENTSDQGNNTDLLSVEFFPESGVLLEKVENKIAFVSKVNNKPISIKGEIHDNITGRKIAEFTSKESGLGIIKLLYFPNSQYTAVVDYNGTPNSFLLPIAKKEGFVIEKKEAQSDVNAISFRIKTNKETLSKKANNFLYAVLHRKGVIQTVIPFKLDNQYSNYSIPFPKDDLLNGTNTITLFNDFNEPIAERLFFYNKVKDVNLNVLNTIKDGDSLTLNFEIDKITTDLNLSISVLPLETKNNTNNKNILTDYLISPYLNKSEYGFNHFINNNIASEALDYYLITSTNTNSFPNKHLNSNTTKYNFEVGVSLKGNVYTSYKKLNECKVMLSSKENNLLLIKKIEDKNRFSFDSIYLRHPSSYKLALIDAKGSILKAAFSVINESNYSPNDTISLEELIGSNTISSPNTTNISAKRNRKTQKLDEVVIKAKKNEIDYSYLLPDPKIIGDSFTKTYKINEDFYLGNNSVFDVIKDLPGVQANLVGGVPMIRSTRGQKSILESRDDPDSSSNFDMTVLLNGTNVKDFRLLYEINASEIEEIKVNGLGGGHGVNGINGVITIETKSVDAILKTKRTSIENHKISATEFGFSTPSESFKNLQLNFPNHMSKTYFNTIDWIPNFTLNPNIKNSLKINLDNHKDIKLIINGFSQNGDLIFKEIDLSIE